MDKKITVFVIFIISLVLLAFSIKDQKSDVGGPFETSNSRSRYALTEAIVENNSITFNQKQAQFAAPDLVGYNGKLFSVFTPGVSFVGVPFYIFGKQFGAPQIFTYLSTLFFALFNICLITKLGRKLGAGVYESLIGGILFIFGTNAFIYSLTFTQHHLSTAVILMAILNALSNRTFINNILFGMLFGAGILMDIPNGLMMLPIAVYVLYKHVSFYEESDKIKLSIKLNFVALVIGLIPFLSLFALYNYQLTGSYTKFSQSLGRADITKEGEVIQRQKESKVQNPFEKGSFYNTRKQLNGIYILLVSNERGWLYYSPIIVIGILGLIIASRKKEAKTLVNLFVAVILFCFISYASFADVWGGWSFGPRYLIPASALACTGIGIAIQKFKKNLLFFLIFIVLAIYSIFVNTLGAMTTSAIPPKAEAAALSKPIPYTYEYNLELAEMNKSSSLFYNLFFYNYYSLGEYLASFIWVVTIIILTLYAVKDNNETN